MTDDRMRGLDPRFDAVFQRGSAATSSRSATEDAAPRFTPRPVKERSESTEVQRLEDFASLIQELGDDEDRGLDEVVGEPDEPDEVAEPDEFAEFAPEPTGPRRWELTILVVGIVAIVVGLALSWWWMQANYGGYSFSGPGVPVEFILMQVASQVSTPLITIGLAALVGLLFLRAARARSTR